MATGPALVESLLDAPFRLFWSPMGKEATGGFPSRPSPSAGGVASCHFLAQLRESAESTEARPCAPFSSSWRSCSTAPRRPLARRAGPLDCGMQQRLKAKETEIKKIMCVEKIEKLD
ncbi:effector of transcription2 [Striga asiatica]|uniref:Effector of transcription2 n=1 Tax=Striga asiatica TaxID=4170 RepID=A0A5A7PP37_STRAF|nr:effector of transcription2 [Striga asiatica]